MGIFFLDEEQATEGIAKLTKRGDFPREII